MAWATIKRALARVTPSPAPPPDIAPSPERPPAEGWWMASDGEWYPPEARTKVRCAEVIKEAATVCRYCGHYFAASRPPPPVNYGGPVRPPSPAAVQAPARSAPPANQGGRSGQSLWM